MHDPTLNLSSRILYPTPDMEPCKNVQAKAPRLDIKKDSKGMVVVPGATMLEVTSAKELMAQITAGQTHRHVASTQVRRLHPTGLSVN